jgi:hypothetical protein
MAKVKKGDKLGCAVCDLVVVVDKACGCASTAIICCGKPMGAGKPAAKAVKKAAPVAVKPVKAAAATKAKAGAAKTTVAAKKTLVKAAAVKPKAAPVKAAPKKAPAKKK